MTESPSFTRASGSGAACLRWVWAFAIFASHVRLTVGILRQVRHEMLQRSDNVRRTEECRRQTTPVQTRVGTERLRHRPHPAPARHHHWVLANRRRHGLPSLGLRRRSAREIGYTQVDLAHDLRAVRRGRNEDSPQANLRISHVPYIGDTRRDRCKSSRGCMGELLQDMQRAAKGGPIPPTRHL